MTHYCLDILHPGQSNTRGHSNTDKVGLFMVDSVVDTPIIIYQSGKTEMNIIEVSENISQNKKI